MTLNMFNNVLVIMSIKSSIRLICHINPLALHLLRNHIMCNNEKCGITNRKIIHIYFILYVHMGVLIWTLSYYVYKEYTHLELKNISVYFY